MLIQTAVLLSAGFLAGWWIGRMFKVADQACEGWNAEMDGREE